MKTLSHFLLLLLLLPACALAQDYKRTWNWYFGDSSGISFVTNPPTALNNSGMKTVEGCATISDNNGVISFYTNGEIIWNKNHAAMQNGTGLNGSWDATQPAIIVPQPENDSLYYVFTVDRLGQSKGLQYSIVNMNADNGLGAVISKNIPLQTPVCEKLAATKHQNGKDIWVVAHGFGNNTFLAYLITKDGLINCPVMSNIGSIHDNSGGSNAQGAMKFSSSGKKIAITVFGSHYVEIFYFNKSTGQIMLPIITTLYNLLLPYGIEFSYNEEYVYVTHSYGTKGFISQHNIIDASPNTTRFIIDSIPNRRFHSLQLANDKKIYLVSSGTDTLRVINFPDSSFESCAFTRNGLLLNKMSQYGLPNFISSYFYCPTLDFRYTFSCNEPKANFVAFGDSSLTLANWNFKHISKGTSSTFSSLAVEYTFPDTGFYEISVTTNNDTVIKTIFIDSPILPQTDTLGCGVDSVLLSIPSSYRCVQWGDTSAQLYKRTIKTNGTYVVQGYNSNGCLITDSIKIHFSPTPQQPIITKANDSLYSSPSFKYQWFLNDTALSNVNTQSIKPLKAGMYKVIISDSNGCSNISTDFSSNVGVKYFENEFTKIYPNPARQSFVIETNNNEYTFVLTNSTGQKLLCGQLNNGVNEVNSSILSSGIYFIHLTNFTTTYVKKIIIQ